MLSEKRKELTEKIAYKNWQLRSNEKDEQGDDNPLFGHGSEETDIINATKIITAFEDEFNNDSNIQDYLDLFGDILENYFNKDYLYTYVQRNTNC